MDTQSPPWLGGRVRYYKTRSLYVGVPGLYGTDSIFDEFCYGVSGVPQRYLEELKLSFNLSH
jgi:hypothetical protein